LKKHFIALLFLLSLLFSFYSFEFFNNAPHKLKSDEYSFKIYQLSNDGNWSDYKKEDNLTYIKSVLTFKKNGQLKFNFNFKKEALKKPLSYQIFHNKKRVDEFNLSSGKKHEVMLSVSKSDNVEIIVERESNQQYWGDLESSFYFLNFSFDDYIVASMWVLFILFLYYQHYGYLALFSSLLFFMTMVSEKLNFGFVSLDLLLAYTFYFFTLSLFLLLIYQLLNSIKKFKIATFLVLLTSLAFILIPLLFMLYSLNFNHELTKESLYAIFQSNGGEAYEYIEKFIDVKYIILAFLIPSLFSILIYKQEQVEIRKIDYRTLLFLILFFILITLMNSSKYRLNNFIYEHIEEYKKELKLFKEVQAKRKAGQIHFDAKKEGEGETYVVVIGESLNKNHMGLYGYVRETTPNLLAMKKELILYQNAYSNHTHTVPVLSQALTEANQYNGKNYYESLSIVNIFNKANFETYWLTNQTLYGGWDNMVSAIATESNHIVALNHTIGYRVETQKYDGELVQNLEKILMKKSHKNRVIFIHLIGSHSTYASRYPQDKFSIFDKATLKDREVKNMRELNTYDNSIYYNDYVVSSILKLLQKKQGIRGFLYFSDHSEEIEKDLGHSWERFTYEMTEIPFISWFSQEYREQYSEQYSTFTQHKNKLFSNDMVYDTLIGLTGVKTEKYNGRYDLSSSEYRLLDEDALVLHGKKRYVTPENHRYLERKKAVVK